MCNFTIILKQNIFYLPVTLSLSPIKQPKMDAKSPTTAVMTPIIARDKKKQGQPPRIPGGGMSEKITYDHKLIS